MEVPFFRENVSKDSILIKIIVAYLPNKFKNITSLRILYKKRLNSSLKKPNHTMQREINIYVENCTKISLHSVEKIKIK